MLFVIIEIGDQHAAQSVDRVGQKGPVHKASAHCELRGLRGKWLNAKLIELAPHIAVVNQRFIDAPGHDARGHTAGQCHGKPGHERYFRFRIFSAQADIAQFRKCDNCHQDGAPYHDVLIEPSERIQ
ncbi:hypothetical protein SDC9_68318 [bioreactor metagenome]|uniref:Uncharacterized protein n=1 Tax=bioreactor metagenome TaxID=1076179 RepID=A0A644Y1H4_9ZZZZ